MFGNTSGFATSVKKVTPHVIVTHCFLHRHILATKGSSKNPERSFVNNHKGIIFIRSKFLNRHIFKIFYLGMGAENEDFSASQKFAGFQTDTSCTACSNSGQEFTYSIRKRKPILRTL
jgi:hypothetical protein